MYTTQVDQLELILEALDAEIDDQLSCEWGGNRAGRAHDPECAQPASWKVFWRSVCGAGVPDTGEGMSLFCDVHAHRLRRCEDDWRCTACRHPLRGDIWHAVARFEPIS
jgi:hypothetical protein